MLLIEIKKIAQVISNLFVISNEDNEVIEKVNAISDEDADEDICRLALSNLYDIYKRVYDNPQAIVVDRFY